MGETVPSSFIPRPSHLDFSASQRVTFLVVATLWRCTIPVELKYPTAGRPDPGDLQWGHHFSPGTGVSTLWRIEDPSAIRHPPSAIHCGTHPLNGVLQRRTIFVLTLGETYCTCKCIAMDTVWSSPSRHVGTFHAHTKCRSSAKLPELRSSRRRRCCIRQAATDGAGLGRCQPPATSSVRSKVDDLWRQVYYAADPEAPPLP